jgi:hypothetical protein
LHAYRSGDNRGGLAFSAGVARNIQFRIEMAFSRSDDILFGMQADLHINNSFLHLFQEPAAEASDDAPGIRTGEIEVRTETREQLAQTTGLFTTSYRLL